MKQKLHVIADTIVNIFIDFFVVWTGLHTELYMHKIIIVSGSCTQNQA